MKKNILLFGGNGFIGKATVCFLSEDAKNYNILTANRGSKIWQTFENKDHSKNIGWVFCDRKRSCEQFPEFVKAVGETFYDFVIDFSGYSASDVERTTKFLSGRCGLYIFVSSDSVYEVCEKHHQKPTREDDAVRPRSKEEQKRLKKQDSYGHKKLACEEVLVEEQRRSGMRYLIVRLADVIGPMDSTDRWWTCQLWTLLAAQLDQPVLLPQEVEMKQLSFVYSKDVACFLRDVIAGKYERQNLENQIYNLACTETISMKDLFSELCKACKVKNVNIQYSKRTDVPWFFPSVNKGPVDSGKVQGQLGWKPTPLLEAIKETADFYTQVHVDTGCTREKSEIIETVLDDLNSVFSGTDIENILKNILNC